MCGLIGGTGKLESRYLIALGCLSEKRGSDSAGVAWQVGERLRLAKIAQNPLVAFPVSLAPAIRHAAKYGGALIGHTRAATTGKVCNENAHPFLEKESQIAWAHNGIISNYATFGTYEVDSECLIKGIKERDFTEFFGPIALLWIEKGKLHAYRKGNPLYRGVRRGAVYLASEQEMLAEIGCKRIKELSEARVYVWDGTKLESTLSVPCNKTYWSTRSMTPYTADFPDYKERAWENYDQGGFWDHKTGRWVDEKDATDERRQGRHRPAGFRFHHSIIDSPKADSGASPTPETEISSQVRDGGVVEPDTLAEADAQDERAALVAEFADMEKLCIACQSQARVPRTFYCETCQKARYAGLER